jgi:hypothetical protein
MFTEAISLLSHDSDELGRDIEPWTFDALGQENPTMRHEKFMAIDYLGLHILKPNAASAFIATATTRRSLLLSGVGIVVGDSNQFPPT